MKKEQSGYQMSRKYMRSRDVRAMLGISDSTLQHLRDTGAIPAYRLGKSWFYREDKIIEALNDGQIQIK